MFFSDCWLHKVCRRRSLGRRQLIEVIDMNGITWATSVNLKFEVLRWGWWWWATDVEVHVNSFGCRLHLINLMSNDVVSLGVGVCTRNWLWYNMDGLGSAHFFPLTPFSTAMANVIWGRAVMTVNMRSTSTPQAGRSTGGARRPVLCTLIKVMGCLGLVHCWGDPVCCFL